MASRTSPTAPANASVHFGIDIGGTKTLAVALDADGRIMGRRRLPTGRGADGVLGSAADSALALARSIGVPMSDVASVGVGVPGRVDRETGLVTHAVNLGFDSLDLGSQLAERLGAMVHVENDVNAAALGAYHRMTADVYDHSMAYLNLGTGLAAGIVVDGRLRRGARGTAGEIGHISVDPSGAPCTCGQRGCLETVASGGALVRQWPTKEPSAVHALKSAHDRGDASATGVWRSLVDGIASAVHVLVLTVDVDSVVIGGGVATLGDELLAGVQARLGERAASSPFIASLGLAERVRLVSPDFPAASIGAAYVGRDAAELVDAA